MDGFIFPHLLEEDTREPMFLVTIPSFLTKHIEMLLDPEAAAAENNEQQQPADLRIGLLMLSLPYWIELLGFLVAALSVAGLVGLFLYKTVIEPKLERTPTAYLIGWGLILPFWTSWPILLFKVIDFRNAIFRFLVGGICPIICFFRTVEAIYGLCPEYVTRSTKDFLFYYATVPIVARAKKNEAETGTNSKSTTTALAIGDPIPCSNSQKLKHMVRFLGLLLLTGALQSILMPHKHLNIFGMGNIESNDNEDEISWHSSQRYFTWQLYGNSALQALLFQLYLTTYLQALEFAFSVATGFEAEPGMLNPLLESASPTEFWGKRWNTIVHTVLKNGVYKPLRLFKVPPIWAILATFLASGVFHEWILLLVFVNGNTNSSNGWSLFESDRKDEIINQTYGGATVFFAWQALLIAFELFLGKTSFVQWFARRLPLPVKTALVVGMGVPLAHFFLEPYVTSGFFFQHGATGLPMMVLV